MFAVDPLGVTTTNSVIFPFLRKITFLVITPRLLKMWFSNKIRRYVLCLIYWLWLVLLAKNRSCVPFGINSSIALIHIRVFDNNNTEGGGGGGLDRSTFWALPRKSGRPTKIRLWRVGVRQRNLAIQSTSISINRPQIVGDNLMA